MNHRVRTPIRRSRLLHVEPHTLGQRQRPREVHRVGGTAHIGFPRVGTRFTTATGFLFTAEGTPYLGTRGAKLMLAIPQSEPLTDMKVLPPEYHS